MRKIIVLAFLFIWNFQTIYAQVVTDLFEQRNELSGDYHQIAGNYQALQLNPQRLSLLQNQAPQELSLQIPFENNQLTLSLKRVTITSDNFSVIEAKPDGTNQTVNYSNAVFYQGKISGMPSSFVTVSLVGNEVIGVLADAQSNIVLGTIENNGSPTNEYVLYRDRDLIIANPINCFTSDEDTPQTMPGGNAPTTMNRLTTTGEPVDIYFECDFKFYQDKGSNTINVINYVLGFFNNTALLYSNEDIQVQISQIKVWTTQDPEAASNLNSTSAVLNAFSNRVLGTNYIGDYAHFLSRRSLGGGIAWLLSNPCASSKFNRSAVSAINNTYNNFPTYSWTVQVVTHELGHNFGSHHTHWCGWSGGAIDNCSAVEGSCSPGPFPTNGGTIMSYCHLTGAGINFNNGFGTQPGNTIRSVIGAAACFGSCRMTIAITKQDASCGQSNGSATVTATNSTGTLTYLWSNGQTGQTLSNASTGTYHVTVTDDAGCQVMEDIVIGNSGTNLNFALTPLGTAGFCAGSDITLTTTNNPAYTYQWSRNSTPIGGATSFSYVANTVGNYSVTVTSGACSGTLSVQVSQVATPTASVTASGPTTFCNGENVLLDADIGSNYMYQWYKDGQPITDAINGAYGAVASGSYSVKVSAGNNCEATSGATVVTVNPSPIVDIALTGNTTFCQGGSVLFTASTGTGYTYQWNKDGNPIPGATQSTYSANTAGSYTVTTTLGPCSRTSVAIPVTVLPTPTVIVTPSDTTIKKFTTVTLTASGASSYNWSSLPDLVGSTTNTGTYRPLSTTTYNVQGTTANGCKATGTSVVTVIGCGEVTNIDTVVYSPATVLVTWKNPQDVTSDTLQYRKEGTSVWNKVFVTGEQYVINNLEPGTRYEYNIIPLCTTTTTFVASPTKIFITDPLEDGLYISLRPNFVNTPASSPDLQVISAVDFKLNITIYDNSGKFVAIISSSESHTAGQVTKSIDAAKLANGLYYILVGVNDKKRTIKMLVSH